MIKKLENEKAYLLSTENTSYAFRVTGTGQIEHLYYGRKVSLSNVKAFSEKQLFAPGNSISYDDINRFVSLENRMMEASFTGKGDIREPLIEAILPDGSTTLDFVFESDEIKEGAKELLRLPFAYSDDSDQAETLTITLKDKNSGLLLFLFYTVFPECDCIVKSLSVKNDLDEDVRITRLLSSMCDFPEGGYTVSNFTGSWANEMNRHDTHLSSGIFINSSFTGTSSNRANPFTMWAKNADEDNGEVFASNLIYSGNHYTAFETTSYGKMRVVTGINPRNFSVLLSKGESIEAPQAVLTYSDKGCGGMSKNMHSFVRNHIIRGKYKNAVRPMLINSWEAQYFNIDEGKLLSLAKKAAEAGCELFVMDDGWFSNRNSDASSLGDWTVNEKKLPHGLSGLSEKIRALNMGLGIWIEPEMVNVDSELYREHPDWTMDIPGRDHSEGRNQRLLDLANPDVVSYISEKIISVLSSADISYVKWDMNRIISDYYSRYLPKERQLESGMRYVEGFYELCKRITNAFPDILFEGCASGGNRFDLGMLCFFPQIWASDNTDAVSRISIQEGYSYAYPQETWTSHVSSVPNHQTLRRTPLSSRFAVAAMGNLGFEMNFSDMKKEEFETVKEYAALYKKYRETLQTGDFLRVESGNRTTWVTVSKDKTQAILMQFQITAKASESVRHIRFKGLDREKDYRLSSLSFEHDIRLYGDLVNTVSPIHVKQDSFLHNTIARFVHMKENGEDIVMSGDDLMNAGVYLNPAYVGTGLSDDTATIGDYGARMYLLESIEEKSP